MTRAPLLIILLSSACDATDSADSPSTPIDSDAPGDSDDSTPDGHTGDSDDTGDTGDTGDTAEPVPGPVTGLEWHLHEETGSLVYVSWEQSETGTTYVEYGLDGEEWMSSPPFEAEIGEHEQILLGIPYEAEASWQVVMEGVGSFPGAAITTAELPKGLPVPSLEVAEPAAWLQSGKFLLASINEDEGGWTGGTYWTYIVDRQGRPVWASAAPNRNWTLYAQVAVTGDHILWDEATRWSKYDDGAESKIHRCYLDGEIDVLAARGLHHAFVQLPDETLVWGSQDHGGGEALVKRAPKEKEETVLWTCEEDWSGVSYCESNGIFYSLERDAFLYSFYTNNSLVEVDHATGETLWWAGQVSNGYGFNPSNAQFSWQHGVSYTDEGNLLVSTKSASGGHGGGYTTMLREYEVDHKLRELREVWSYDPDVYASTNGDAWRLDNGNTLHLLGSAGHIYEVTVKGEVVWHLDYDSTRLLGRGEFIEDLYELVSSQGY